MTPMVTGIKVPCEMAVFALRERVLSQVGVYLASHFSYSGKAKNTTHIVNEVSSLLPIKDRQIRRNINWLIERNWIHKSHSGWYYFRAIDNVHRIEGWKFSRATKFHSKDFKYLKAYLCACMLTSLVETGIQDNRTVRKNRRTETPSHPVSLSSIMNILQCSKDTARILRNEANAYQYIKSEENLKRIKGLSPETLSLMRSEGLSKIRSNFFGEGHSEIIAIDRIRFKEGSLFYQLPNLIQSNLQLKGRRGLNKYNPYLDNNGT